MKQGDDHRVNAQHNQRNSLLSYSNIHFKAKFYILLLTGLIFLLPNTVQAQAPDNPPSPTGGQVLWAENCLPCHGISGQGDGPTAAAIENPLPNFSTAESARQMIPTESFEVIKNGRIENLMPPWGNSLTDAQIWDLTALVWQLGTPPEDVAAGQAIYVQECAACHGDSGQGDGSDAPATIIDFTDLATMVQTSQAKLQVNYVAGTQHASLDLSETELWQALDYIRTFSFVLPQRDGVLSGQVFNATTNDPAANLPLTLRIFQGDSEVETITAQTDETGRYEFVDLSTDPALLYLVEGNYQTVAYQSEPSSFVHSGAEATLNLNIYETTTNDETIDITQLHYIVAFAPEGINILQIYVVGNRSDRTYIGNEAGHTFAFAMPENATDLTFQGLTSETRFVETETGYFDTEPIVPGEEGLAIAMTYNIPYEGDTVTVETPLSENTNSINLLLEAREVGLNSEQLEFIENRDIQGDQFAIYSGPALNKGERFTFQLDNLSALISRAAPENVIVADEMVDQNLLRWVIFALGGLTVIGAGIVYPLLRPQPEPQPTPQAESLDQRRRRLLLTIARLDETFEAGDLDEAVYRQARATYKSQVADSMGQQ